MTAKTGLANKSNMKIPMEGTLLFFGDSITDSARDPANPASLGVGYVNQIASRIGYKYPSPARRVINAGVGGNRIYDLERRLESDLIAHQPSLVTILVGINDTWRQFDSNRVSSIADFRAAYERILVSTTTRIAPCPRLILMEPFVLPDPEDRRTWRTDLDSRIAVVRDLAVQFNARLIPLDGLFSAAATRAPASYWLHDGVHPTPAGHALIAEAWLSNMNF
ncbi:MAG: SGNH/GDSL hydrolase family protein [Opitutaceae bacterium]|nr:SGNH/GDSL hydrolase family protein [Opitutaceae bacterium]